jgi:hypothetical protein
VTAPVAVRVTRYQDPWCGRTHSSRKRAVEHMGRCWRNPDARGCLTCRHFEPAIPGEVETGWPGETEGCAVGVSLAGRPECPDCYGGRVGGIEFDTPQTVCPSCNGNHTAVKPGPIVHCEKWEASNADR